MVNLVHVVFEWPPRLNITIHRHSSRSIRATILPFAKMMSSQGNHFGKRTALSLLYFLICAYLNISACRKFLLSLSPSKWFHEFFRTSVGLFITSISGLCVVFILKTYHIVASTSMIWQFHELLGLIFGGFWRLAQLCALAQRSTVVRGQEQHQQ